MWTPVLVSQMFCTLVPLAALPQGVDDMRGDQPPRGTEGSGPGAMEQQQLVVLRAFRVCSMFSMCASCSPLVADVLCDARIPRSTRPPCCASSIPSEPRSYVLPILQQQPPEAKGEVAQQGFSEAAQGAAAGAEVSARGVGGPASEQMRVVVSMPLARYARVVLLRRWNLPRPLPAFCVFYVFYLS